MTGGKWGIAKDLFAGLKVMGLPRANKLIRATFGVGPSESAVNDRVRALRHSCGSQLCPHDVEGRLRRTARIWAPIIREKLEHKVIKGVDRIPITCGSDVTPVPAHPRYCARRNVILGLCGPVSPAHKCSLAAPVKILNGEAGFNQIIDLVTGHVWSSYVYTHILQPQVHNINASLRNDCLTLTHAPAGGLAPTSTRAYLLDVQ